MFVLEQGPTGVIPEVPGVLCDLCAAPVEAEGASLLLRILLPGYERNPNKMRAALVLPDGRALYGTSFVLCRRCTAEVRQQIGCADCLPFASWDFRPLPRAIADIALGLIRRAFMPSSSPTEER